MTGHRLGAPLAAAELGRLTHRTAGNASFEFLQLYGVGLDPKTSLLYTDGVTWRNFAWSLGVALFAAALTVAAGAMGLLSTEGALGEGVLAWIALGGLIGAAILVFDLVQGVFGRAPERIGPEHAADSVERHRLQESSAEAFGDTLVFLCFMVVASSSGFWEQSCLISVL